MRVEKVKAIWLDVFLRGSGNKYPELAKQLRELCLKKDSEFFDDSRMEDFVEDEEILEVWGEIGTALWKDIFKH